MEQRHFEVAIGLRRPVVRGVRAVVPAGLRLARGGRLPALRLGQELVLTGEIVAPPASGSVEMTGRLEGEDYRLAIPLGLEFAQARRNPLVSALFARQRISELLRTDGEAEKAEIIRLSTSYRTMSPYTSFLVLENDEMFQRYGVVRTQKGERSEPAYDYGEELGVDSSIDDLMSAPEELSEVEKPRPVRTRAGGSHSGPRPASPPSPPASAPAAPPKAKKSSSAADDEGRAAEASASPRDPLLERFDEPPGAYVVRKKYHVPRAHLTSTAADDVWRTWAAADLERVRVALERAPESRSRMEEFVRLHLAQGRFREAADVARRFVAMDPDYLLAQDLLAQAAVVSGDHELARLMLDVQAETSPRAVSLHRQAASAFESAGDAVRACAHRRALAELEPQDLIARERANHCFGALLGAPGDLAPSSPPSVAPQLQVKISCEGAVPAADCPAPVLVAPDGRITSPWTPGAGVSDRTTLGLQKVRTGTYFVLLLGGAPGVRGKVEIAGRHERTSFAFTAGGLRTIARTQVSFY